MGYLEYVAADIFIASGTGYGGGDAVATNRQVAGSIPDGVIGIFQ